MQSRQIAVSVEAIANTTRLSNLVDLPGISGELLRLGCGFRLRIGLAIYNQGQNVCAPDYRSRQYIRQ